MLGHGDRGNNNGLCAGHSVGDDQHHIGNAHDELGANDGINDARHHGQPNSRNIIR